MDLLNREPEARSGEAEYVHHAALVDRGERQVELRIYCSTAAANGWRVELIAAISLVLAALRAAVLRTDSQRPPWRPEQAIPAGAALESFTVAPAWLSFDEHRRGRLRAGFDADLAVLDRDPLAQPPASVADARLVATMVAGEWVHGPGW